MIRLVSLAFLMAMSPMTGLSQDASETASRSARNRALSSPNYNTPDYIHSWQKFPNLLGKSLSRDEVVHIKPERGISLVVIFLASWCLPCQQLMKDFQKLEETYEDRFTRFVYVFAHDTAADARAFRQAYKIGDNALLGTPQILKDFNQPELPSIYVSDRQTWMVKRKLSTQRQHLAEIDFFLNLHTAN